MTTPPPSVGVISGPSSALEAARAVARELAGRAAVGDAEGRFLAADLAALRTAGLLALMVPSRLGGAGASFSDYIQVAIALAAGNGAPALVFNMHASVSGALALTSDDLARSLGATERYFAARDTALEAARDGAFYAVAMSERGAGARLSALSTRYRREGEGFRLVGSKSFVSGADLADAYLVAACAEEDATRVSYFLVPAGLGTEVEQVWDSLGMRATGSNDLHLDVYVTPDSLLGGVEGLGLLIAQLMPQWLVASYAAVYVGVAKGCLDAAVQHLNDRSLARLPAVRARIGRADAAIAAAELVVLEAARLVDAAPGAAETNRFVYRAKLLAGDTATRVAASMLEAAGASATRRGHPLERLFRDAMWRAAARDLRRLRRLARARSARIRSQQLGDPTVVTADAAVISSSASAFPLAVSQAELWEGFFSARSSNRRAARLAFRASGIERRHAAVNPLTEDISEWSTAQRMVRYTSEAMPLAKEALSRAIEGSGRSTAEIGFLAVASCTGYATPGIDVRLARDLGMSPELKRLLIGHVGCHAALPALEAVRDFVLVQQRPAALLCLELPSLHLQVHSEELDQFVVNALFSDAASALVVEPASSHRRGLAVLDIAARSDTATASYIGWEIGDRGFEMTLSSRVPEVLAEEIYPLVEGLLARNGVGRDAVASWAIHPGGPRIIDVVGERLQLGDEDLAPSRRVLREHGNCSSPTILMVLEEIASTAPTPTGEYVVALTFGPGLTLYGALLRST